MGSGSRDFRYSIGPRRTAFCRYPILVLTVFPTGAMVAVTLTVGLLLPAAPAGDLITPFLLHPVYFLTHTQSRSEALEGIQGCLKV